MEQGGFFDGVPLSAVKSARFINKIGTFFTLAKLIYNGTMYNFSGGGGGTVVVDPQYLKWQFVAPDDLFDLDTLEAMTLSQMLNSVADTITQSPIKEWNDFAAWIAQDNISQMIQDVFNQGAYGGVKGVLVPRPQFQPPDSFADFLRWLASISGDAGSLSASEFLVENKFTYEISLFATRGIRVMLTTPPERPALQDGDTIFPSRLFYTSQNGMVDKPMLAVSTDLCPSFTQAYSEYDSIVYAYEETHDTMGLGLTLAPGWHAANTSTFTVIPFDLEANPIAIEPPHLEGVSGINWEAIYPMARPEIVGEPDAVVAFLFQI